jgi:hypothetical protein
LAESQGKVLNSHIKAYAFTKLDKADINALKEELEKTLQLERDSFNKIIIELMGAIILAYEVSGKKGLDEQLMNQLDEARAHLKTI